MQVAHHTQDSVCVYAFMYVYVYVHCVVHGEHSRVDPGRLEAREGHLAHERRKHLRAVVHPVAAREQTQAAHAGAVSVSCTWDMRRPTPYPACLHSILLYRIVRTDAAFGFALMNNCAYCNGEW